MISIALEQNQKPTSRDFTQTSNQVHKKTIFSIQYKCSKTKVTCWKHSFPIQYS